MTPYLQQTKNWIQSVVIGLNFCPFARQEFINNKIRYTIFEACGLECCIRKFVEECQYLDSHEEISTTLIIYPCCLDDFQEYLEVVNLAEEGIIEFGYEGIYQVASFHPKYMFEGSSPDDPTNYTNRSPYPMLHLLREDLLEEQLEKHPNPEQIPISNIEKANQLGLDTMMALLTNAMEV